MLDASRISALISLWLRICSCVPSHVGGLYAPKGDPFTGAKMKGVGTLPMKVGALSGNPVSSAVEANHAFDAATEAGVAPGKVKRAKSAEVPSAINS